MVPSVSFASKLASIAVLSFFAATITACSDDEDSSTGATPAADGGGASGGECTAAKQQTLTPVATPSSGAVTVIGEIDGKKKTVYVDASAGGAQAAATNARVYINLETASRVDVDDVAAATSTAWDLAIKRTVLFTNSGDGGSGAGGSSFLAGKEFDAVTTADTTSIAFTAESFFDEACNAKLDQTNAVKTSFDGWYDYDMATHKPTPKAGVWVVKGATGKLFKVKLLSYYANPDGSVGEVGGRYTLEVAAL